MSKDPAFLFYPNDYLGGTMGFSLAMHGGYLILLIYQFNQGPFTSSAAISLIGNDTWELIKHKFKNDGKLFWNQRLRDEMEKRALHCENQRENALKRWGKNNKPLSGKKITIMPSQCHRNALAMPLEDENRNENKDIIKSLKEEEKERGVEKEKEETTWHTDYPTYQAEEQIAYTELIKNTQWIDEQERLKQYPNLDVYKSLQKAHQYWSSENGWKYKVSQSRRIKKDGTNGKINWKLTYQNSLTIGCSQVFGDYRNPPNTVQQRLKQESIKWQ